MSMCLLVDQPSDFGTIDLKVSLCVLVVHIRIADDLMFGPNRHMGGHVGVSDISKRYKYAFMFACYVP
jgi:hypothetical protein